MRINKKKIIFHHQLDAMDCGPACLQMIAAFYGRKIPLQLIRDRAHITRQGVSILGLAKAAESLGFKTKGLRLSIKKLSEDTPLPCIVHWKQEHFIVLYKISSKKNGRFYFVADPGSRKFRLTENEFLQGWTSCVSQQTDMGICLVIEPSEGLFTSGETPIPNKKLKFKFLMNYLSAYRTLFLQLVAGLLFGSVLQLIFPFLTQAIVDKSIRYKDTNLLYIILSGYLFLTIASTFTDYVRRWILLQIGSRLNVSIMADFLYKLMNLPLSFFDRKMTGDLLRRIEDHNNIEKFLTSGLLSLLFSLISIIVFGVVLCYFNMGVFTFFLVSSVVYIVWVTLFMKKREQVDYKRFILESVNKSSVLQLISGIQDIKLNNCELQKRWEWEAIQAKLFKVRFKGLQIEQLQTVGGSFINHIRNLAITLWSAKLVIDGSFSLGEMLSMQFIIGQLNAPVADIITFMFSFQDASISLKRLTEIHSTENENINGVQAVNDLESKSIAVSNVSFKYDGAALKNTIENVTLSIDEGKFTAIVGASGSGKTTLVKLLLGFYPPDKGSIIIGGTNLAKIDSEAWRAACGAVMQDGYIFTDTIARNIALASKMNEIDIDRLLHASDTANITQFIMNLPLKFDTIIGTEGQGLSQGQKQRILIARAIYKNPDYLFFDEATNALDTTNEKKIINNLASFFEGKTVVVIAHRLSSVKKADKIIVLDEGKVVEHGNHESLVEKKGFYYELVKNQLELEIA